MIAASFLNALAQAPQQQVARYGQAIDADWFERPHDAVIFTAVTEVSSSCRPSLPLVVGHLVATGRYSREVKARCEDITGVEVYPEQLPHLARALLTQAFRRIHREGTEAILHHLDDDTDAEVWQRLRDHGQRVGRIRTALAELGPQQATTLKVVGA